MANSTTGLSFLNSSIFPINIDYCVVVERLADLLKGGFIKTNRAGTRIPRGSIICWACPTEHMIVISIFESRYRFRILYSRHYFDEEATFMPHSTPSRHFSHANLKDVSDVMLVTNFWAHYRRLEIEEELKNQGIENSVKSISKVGVKTQPIMAVSRKECETYTGQEISFFLDGQRVTLTKGQVWRNSWLSHNQTYVNKSNFVGILVGESNLIHVNRSSGRTTYDILGCGQDIRFDQCFGQSDANTAIRDNDKQILLFEKDENGNIRLLDAVATKGYDEVVQSVGSRQRKVLVFHLASLFQTRNWTLSVA